MSGYSQERLMQVLLAPQISEKATYVADKNEQVVFRVATDATKPEVKAAVELLFKVEVESPTSRARSSASVVVSAAARTGRRRSSASSPARKSTLRLGSNESWHW
jgi:ribosomal protein L23